MGKVKNEVGNRYGRLSVIEMLPPKETDRNQFALARCRCDCGNDMVTRGSNLRRGETRSCGCLQKETAASYRKAARKASVPEEAIKRKYNEYVRSAKKRSIEFSLSIEEFVSICSSECIYCGEMPREILRNTTVSGSWTKLKTGVFMHGIDRIDSSLGYIEDNVVPCCWLCNQSKNDMSLEDFKSLIARQYKNMFNQPHRFYLRPDSQDISYSEAA